MIDTSADATSLSPWWRHSAILVMIAGFSVLSLVTVLTYTNAPPIPERATDVTGTVVFTRADFRSETLGHPRNDRWLLGSILSDGPDLHECSTDSRAGHGCNGNCGVYQSRHPNGPGCLPQVRSHGARQPVGPWGLSRSRLQCGVPA